MPANSFVPDDPLDTDVPDEAALGDIARMAEKQRLAETSKTGTTPEQEIEPQGFVPDSFVPDSGSQEKVVDSFVPDSFEPDKEDKPSWLDEVKQDWEKAKETNLGTADVPLAFLRARAERGIKGLEEAGRERINLIEQRRALDAKRKRGLATPEEIEAADELEAELRKRGIEDALNWGPGPIVAGGKVGKLKDLFKELWGRGETAVPQRVLNKAEDILNKYEDKLVLKASKGKPVHEAMQEVEMDMGRTAQEIDDMLFLTGRELRYPSREEAIKAVGASRGASVEERELAQGGFISDLLKPVSTRLKELSEKLFGEMRKFEYTIRTQYHKGFSAAEPFLERIESLGARQQKQIKRALLNRDFDVITRLLARDTKALKSFEDARGVLKNLFERQKEHGLKAKEIDNYWPRVFLNTKKALKTLGTKEQSLVMKAFSVRKKQLGRELTDLEKSEILHKTLFGGGKTSNAPGHLRSRKFEQVPDKFLDLYASPRQMLHYYMRDTVLDLAKRDFLGKRLTRQKGTQNIDWESSLAKVILKDYKLSKDSATFDEIRKLLHARMIEGERSPNAFIQAMRNVTYSGTLGNLHAAATQLQDIGLAFSRFGLINTLKTLVGKKHVRTMDFGLRDASIELLHSPSATARWMERFIKYSGFSRMDQFGKETHLNSALRRYWQLAKTPKGRDIISKKYEGVMGREETERMIESLRKKEMTEDVKLLLFNELSDMQPISLLEVPLKYLQAPNGRLFYTLKTFTVRQLDLIMNDTIRQIKGGNVREGTANLAKYITFLSSVGIGVGTIKKWMSGDEVTIDEIPDMAVNDALKIFGGSEFIATLGLGGKAGSAAVKMTAPAPFSIADTIGTDIHNLVTDKEFKFKTGQYIPVMGKFWYYWAGPGLDKINEENKDK